MQDSLAGSFRPSVAGLISTDDTRKQVHLFDLVEDFLFLVPIAAAILGLLAISRFGWG
jgi:hypothetical protein